MTPDHEPQRPSRRTRTVAAVGAIVVLFVVLHLTGVLGPGSR
jgi:hypothetical protein